LITRHLLLWLKQIVLSYTQFNYTRQVVTVKNTGAPELFIAIA
jgi:hypothetical protein